MAFISLLRQLQLRLRLQRRLSHVNLQFNLFIDYVIQALPPAAASIFMHNTCVCVCGCEQGFSLCVCQCVICTQIFVLLRVERVQVGFAFGIKHLIRIIL